LLRSLDIDFIIIVINVNIIVYIVVMQPSDCKRARGIVPSRHSGGRREQPILLLCNRDDFGLVVLLVL
jgi:hypothetical protein